MKVTNWRRKLAASLAAGGLISPAAALAASLDTNLVVNGTFENVDPGVTGDYNAPKVLQWLGFDGFAYSHQPGVTGIPDYADGADPPGAGNWYFTTNNNPLETDFNDPGDFYQDADVSTGATGTQIASGEAAVRLSAYMSSYLDDTDFGNVHVEFRNSGGGSLGSAVISDSDPGSGNVWSLNSGAAMVPQGTATLRVSLFGTRTSGGPGADGYIDNVDVQVTDAANEFVFLEVNTTNGQARIRNLTGDPVRIDYYEISSVAGSLRRNTWTSLQDQNLAGFPPGNGTGNGWEEGGGGGNNVLSENFLTGNSIVNNGAIVGLGQAFGTGTTQDLKFSYAVVSPQVLDADFNGNGFVDGGDFLNWQRSRGLATGATKPQGDADGDADVDDADFAIWKVEFGDGTFSGPGNLVTGFVRYVPSFSVAAVPEPSSVALVGLGLAPLALRRTRKD
jgi:hypothetical protein